MAGPDMLDAVVRVVGDVIKVDERIVMDHVGALVCKRARGSADPLHVSLPRDALLVEEGYAEAVPRPRSLCCGL